MCVKKNFLIKSISIIILFALVWLFFFQGVSGEPISSQQSQKLYIEARELMKGNQYEKAIILYDEFLQYDPTNLSAINNKGIAQYRLGLCIESSETLERGFVINNSDINLLLNLIFSELCAGNFTHSDQLIDKALQNHSENAGLWLAKGIWQRQQGDFSEAIKNMNNSLYLEPGNSEIWYELSKTTALNGALEAAYHQILQGENLSPTDLNIRYYRGVLEERRGMYRDALNTFDKVIASDPNNSWAWFSKGSIYWNHQLFNQSLESFVRVNEIDPNNSKSWFFSGLAYKELGDLNNSRKSFKHALLLEPDNNQYQLYYKRFTTYSGDTFSWDEVREKLSEIFFYFMVMMSIAFLPILWRKKNK